MTPVTLPIAHPRCPDTRTVPCSRADTCARALCSQPGREVQDFSIVPRGMTGECPMWMSAAQYRTAAASAPRVHEAPGWLR